MLKKVLLTSTLIASSFLNVAFASAPTDASVQQAIQLSHVNEMLNESVKNLGSVLDQQAIKIVQKRTGHETLNAQEQKAAQDIGQILKNNTNNLLQQADMPLLISNLFKKYYSEDELQVYIKFLSTPEGQSINKKQPLVVQETVQNVMNILSNKQTQTAQQQASQQVADILNSLPKAK
ncbi:DUF2059 domain-containing protein [Acinetobacter rathckeae]|uniref:DUF2059 domain-containing protein n=1 Tax=Acinetobacter rathckeae TaxID=2605272 RepID=UPI0018A31CB5|nr:DUF2059 domain-containing protein [Acinetobacter rathckeae]MBF7696420.1 DUF2059 domain-containing protein [Acinetobacter rathckeae]